MDKWEWIARHYLSPDEVERGERRYGPALGGPRVSKWEWIACHDMTPDEIERVERRWDFKDVWQRIVDADGPLPDAARRLKIKAAREARHAKSVLALRRLLWNRGLRYRKHPSSVCGRPDIVFVDRRVAVFCDLAFWHGHDWPRRKARLTTNRRFWVETVESTMARDRQVDRELRDAGWLVVRLWDHEVLSEPEACFMKVVDALEAGGARGSLGLDRAASVIPRRPQMQLFRCAGTAAEPAFSPHVQLELFERCR
jgi:DNA mismatch endonuclease, patch repair protein